VGGDKVRVRGCCRGGRCRWTRSGVERCCYVREVQITMTFVGSHCRASPRRRKPQEVCGVCIIGSSFFSCSSATSSPSISAMSYCSFASPCPDHGCLAIGTNDFNLRFLKHFLIMSHTYMPRFEQVKFKCHV
jgi:hypothetical protein